MAYKVPMEHGVAVPMFEIWLDDKEISEFYYKMVEEVNFESHDSGSDTATIYMHDPDLVIIDDKRIFRGKKITLYGGWQGDIVKWLDGYIAMVDIDFPETGDPIITLHCMDESFLLDRMEVRYSYHNFTFAQIAAEIAKRHGLEAKGEPTSYVHESVSQSGETDISLLLRLADHIENDLIVKVRDGKVQWWDRNKVYEAQETLTWKLPPFNLKSFRPRIASADRREGVDSADVHDGTKEVDEGVATPDIIDRPDYGEEEFDTPMFQFNESTGLWERK